MKKRTFLILVILSLLAALAGCTHIAIPVTFFPGSEDYQIQDVAIAVDGSGTKHLFLSENLTGEFDATYVFYLRSKSGEEALKTGYSDMGKFTINPDIAVSYNGKAYMTWQQYEAPWYEAMWATIDPEDEMMEGIAKLEPGTISYSPPVVAGPVVNSASDRIYAVYEIQDNIGSALRYRELSNPTNMGWVSVHPGNNYRRWHPSLAVGQDGVMHVAWIEHSTTGDDLIYNNNYNRTGDLTPDIVITAADTSDPAVAAGYESPTSYGFVVWYQHSSPNDLLAVRVISCAGGGPTPCLVHATHFFSLGDMNWQMSGKPAAIAYGDTVYVAFTADNAFTTGSADEIWLVTYDHGSNTETLAQITNDGKEKFFPAITLASNLGAALPVIAWFSDVPASDEDVVQMYDDYHGYNTTLDTHAKMYFGLDLANGNYLGIAGVWIGNRPPKSGDAKADYYVARMSYNDYPVFLPITIKP